MKEFIRQRIAAGDSKSEIKDQLVAQFGKGVLAAPEQNGFDLLAWVLPIVGLLARRRRARRCSSGGGRAGPRTSCRCLE